MEIREYKDDCIHLKACRRLCKIGKITNRCCNDSCTAYEQEQKQPVDTWGWDFGYFGY